jgi:uncharacterized ubiquitin-like protein YukD
MQVLSSMLTPLIAIVALYIAWQQWKTNQHKLVMDQYDRRLRIYEEVRKILSIVLRDANVSMDDLLRFRTSVSEADFLFGTEIVEYIDDIYRRGLDLNHWASEYRDNTQVKPAGYDHKIVVDGKHRQLSWFKEQFEPAKQRFKKYLDISG